LATPRTEVTINYEPEHFLERPYHHKASDFSLTLEAGKATVVLDAVEDPVSAATLEKVERAVRRILQARQLTTHKTFKMLRAVPIQHLADGGKAIVLTANEGLKLSGGLVDVKVTNSKGEVVHDSRAERIDKTERTIADVLSKLDKDQMLGRLLDSFEKSIADPADEFTHLYEIRDALSERFGGSREAMKALNIPPDEWSRFGKLTNHEPLDQSRHRGQHTGGTRPATPEELKEARDIARRWIEKFRDSL
jgi:hypothetical protein